MVTIILPAGWTQGRQTEFTGTRGQLPDIIHRFAQEHPEYRRRLLGPQAQLLTYLNVCVNDDLIPRDLRATTTVEAGSTITIMAPMAGG